MRYFGNAILSLFTKIASGYWHVADSQAGYAVISREALATLPLDRLYPRYGFPNDVLVHLNVDARKVRDLPSRPIYGIGERSGIRLRKVVPTIGALLFRRFWWRLWARYVVRDFHPLVFFYTFGVDPVDARRAARPARDHPPHRRHAGADRDDRARRAAGHLGLPVAALRDVVRHGLQPRPA